MATIKIEKGIKLPAPRPGRKEKYPFSLLEPGDSFFVPLEDRDPESLDSALSGRIWCMARQHPERKFAKRKVGVGVRVWRVK